MKEYHIGLSKQDIKDAETAILPGDPKRVSIIAEVFGDYIDLEFNREYKSSLVKLKNKSILIISTGIGGSSTSIAIEELAKIGIKTFIRIGTTGAIQKNIPIGSVIISTASAHLSVPLL